MMPGVSSFSVFEASVGDTFQTLAWTTVVFLGLSAMYQWARGPKTPDPKAYQAYLSKLDTFPVDSDVYKRRVITWPNPDDVAEEDYFVSWHSGHIAYLDKIHQWETISYAMESIRRRFPVDSR